MEYFQVFHIHQIADTWKKKNKQTKTAARSCLSKLFILTLSDVQAFVYVPNSLLCFPLLTRYAIKMRHFFASLPLKVASRDIQISSNTLMTYFRMKNFPQDCLNEVANYLKSHALASTEVHVECSVACTLQVSWSPPVVRARCWQTNWDDVIILLHLVESFFYSLKLTHIRNRLKCWMFPRMKLCHPFWHVHQPLFV